MNQEQEQTQGGQSQKQELPPDPVQEQKESYSPPEPGIELDPITEAPKADNKPEEPPKEEPKEEHGSDN